MEDLAFEIRRKLFHVLTVIYIVFYYLINKFCSQRVAIFSLILILMFFAMLEFAKIKFGIKIPLFHRFYRESERFTFSGNIYLLIGIILAFSIFDFNIAAAAVLMMALGDTASSIVGRLGAHRIDGIKASWEGMISEFLVDLAVGFIFVSNFWIILAMALSATIAESLLLAPIDDNLSVPLVAGFAGQSLMIILRIFGLA